VRLVGFLKRKEKLKHTVDRSRDMVLYCCRLCCVEIVVTYRFVFVVKNLHLNTLIIIDLSKAEINLHSKLCHYTVNSVDNIWTNNHSYHDTHIVYTPKNNSELLMLKLVVRETTAVINRVKKVFRQNSLGGESSFQETDNHSAGAILFLMERAGPSPYSQ
jgi:hypothetical protein